MQPSSKTTEMPLQTHWSSHELANAIPLRLSEMLDFDAGQSIGSDRASANGAIPAQRKVASCPYLPVAGFQSAFRIR